MTGRLSLPTVLSPPATSEDALQHATHHTPTFDHHAYPHIMDKILAHAPRSALLPLRGTSKDNRATADKLMATHLVIYNERPVRSASSPPVLAGGGRHPAVLPGPWTAAHTLLAAQAIVIDYIIMRHGYFPSQSDYTGFLPKLTTLRAWSASGPVPTLVDYPHLFQPQSYVWFNWPHPLDTVRFFTPEFWVPPTRLRRVTININVAWPPLPLRLQVWSWIEQVDELIVVFDDTKGRDATQPPIRYESEHWYNATVPLSLQEELSELLVAVLRTVEGGGDITASFINCEISWGHGHFEHLIHRLGMPYEPEDCKDYPSAVAFCNRLVGGEVGEVFRCLTLQEYEAEVGAERFALETDEGYVAMSP